MSCTALLFVVVDVAKPGIVTPRMLARGRPRLSIAWHATRSACVESRPPETPMTSRSMPVADNRVASPCTWMRNASEQRSARRSGDAGTKGKRSKVRSSTTGARVTRSPLPAGWSSVKETRRNCSRRSRWSAIASP